MTQVFRRCLRSPATSPKHINLRVPYPSFLRVGSYALNARFLFSANLCVLCASALSFSSLRFFTSLPLYSAPPAPPNAHTSHQSVSAPLPAPATTPAASPTRSSPAFPAVTHASPATPSPPLQSSLPSFPVRASPYNSISSSRLQQPQRPLLCSSQPRALRSSPTPTALSARSPTAHNPQTAPHF